MQDRIEQAWERCKDWNTEYEGMATQVYFTDIQPDVFRGDISTIATLSDNVDIHPTWWDEVPKELLDNPPPLNQQIDQLISREIADINFIYTINLLDFDFRVQIIVDMNDKNLVDLDFIWWLDEVFSKGINQKDRFFSVASHFIDLQNLFQCEYLYLAPENMERPTPDSRYWMRI